MSGNELARVGKLWRAGQHDQAKSLALELVERDPVNSAFWDTLGLIQALTGHPHDAEHAFRKASLLAPTIGDYQAHLGNALGEQGYNAEAEVAFRMALDLGAEGPDLLRGLGNVLTAQGKFTSAIEVRERAALLEPGRADLRFEWADTLAKGYRLEEALAICLSALEINPDYFPAKRLLWIMRFLTGDLLGGFAAYEARLLESPVPINNSSIPLWSGEIKAGLRLLVHSEQGLGDAILMARYIPLLGEQGIRVTFQCQPSLVGICKSLSGVENILPWGAEVSSVDAWVPLMSLPQRLKTTLQTVPNQVPYLFPDHDRIAFWRSRLGDGIKIGLVWQGNPLNSNDAFRSFPLALLEPVLRLPGYRFFGLQKEHGRGQMEGWPVIDLGPELTDFGETVAVLSVLDLVISCDTSLAHLSGALGRPTWLFLPIIPDWRWLMEREDSPWYPTMRLFRQPQESDRALPFLRMAERLQK